MKNLFHTFFIICILTSFFACSETAVQQEISTVEPYRMESGKMVDRFESAILNMEKEDSLRTAHENEIVFTGSSSIRMWKGLDLDMLPLNAINRGFGGSTIPEMNYYAGRIVIPYKSPLIVFYCGENDISDGYSPKEVEANFKKFDELVRQYLPKTKILFLSMKPSLARWELWPQFVEGNQMIQKYIESKPHLHYFDTSKSMLTAEGTPDSTIFIEDGLHMNQIGYDRWTKELKPVLLSIMGVSEETSSN